MRVRRQRASPRNRPRNPRVRLGGIVLRDAPADLGCDAIGVPYTTVTIRIDPSAADPVWGETDTGTRLGTFWSPSFTGDTSADSVITDANDETVARDGDVITVGGPEGPRLAGYFVCAGLTDIYVLAEDPQ